MQTQCEDKCSGISCWYLDYLDVPENTSVNYPQMTKGSMKIIRITPNSNGTAKIGGSGGKDIYNFSCVICMNDSPGGLEANVGNDFVVIQGGIGQTPVTYNSGVATDIDQNNDINVLYTPPIIVDPNNKLTLKTEYSKLVDLNISPIWNIRDENNQIAYTLTDKLIYLEKGAVVDVSATWAYNTPGINENPPTQTPWRGHGRLGEFRRRLGHRCGQATEACRRADPDGALWRVP